MVVRGNIVRGMVVRGNVVRGMVVRGIDVVPFIWYIFTVLVSCTKKNLATLVGRGATNTFNFQLHSIKLTSLIGYVGTVTVAHKCHQYIHQFEILKSCHVFEILWSCDWNRGRCYYHNFQRFLPICGKKMGVNLKNYYYDPIFD
jgi:hypothetical protein